MQSILIWYFYFVIDQAVKHGLAAAFTFMHMAISPQTSENVLELDSEIPWEQEILKDYITEKKKAGANIHESEDESTAAEVSKQAYLLWLWSGLDVCSWERFRKSIYNDGT